MESPSPSILRGNVFFSAYVGARAKASASSNAPDIFRIRVGAGFKLGIMFMAWRLVLLIVLGAARFACRVCMAQ